MAKSEDGLSRRERQIVEVLYRRGRATVAEVMAELPEAPGYSGVRAQLRTLEEKGHVRHEQDGPRYVYLPTVPLDKARRSALKTLVSTFFGGSAEQLVCSLVDGSATRLSREELDRIARLVNDARSRKGAR
jgi:BlaI family penicillinase repressor